jgi:hypothetical protein
MTIPKADSFVISFSEFQEETVENTLPEQRAARQSLKISNEQA